MDQRRLASSLFALLFGIFYLNDHVRADLWSFRIITESTTIMTSTKESIYAPGTPVTCSVHENCTSRILTLDAYCCQSIGTCCNWFLYTSYFQFKSTLPYKAPTILTILTILIVVVAILFCSYCFGIIFCYFFKCGLFRHPKIVIVSSMPTSNSASGSTSAEMISPKHSTSSTSSSASSASSTSSSSQSSSLAANRRRQASGSRATKAPGYKSKSTPSASKPRSSNYKPSRSGSGSSSSARNQSYRNLRSSNSRAASSSNSKRTNTSYNNDHSEIYIDYDNDSPFLIPPQLSKQTQKTRTSRNHYLGDTVINEERESGAVAASSRGRNRTSSYRTSLIAAGGSTSEQASRQYPLGTAVAYVDDDQLAPSMASPTSSTSSALGFGASLMEAVETAVADNGIDLVTTARSSLIMASSTQPSAPSAANYYIDEKPPSYDDIIGRNY